MKSFQLETTRLYLREFQLSDALAMWSLNSDPEVLRYTGDQAFNSLEDAHSFLENYKEYQRQGFGRWAVIRKSDGTFLGWCGLKQNEGFVDIGFRFFRAEWNKGYATEAAKVCIEYGFTTLKLPFIVGRVARENGGSIKVLEKLGLEYWKSDACMGIPDALYYRIVANRKQP